MIDPTTAAVAGAKAAGERIVAAATDPLVTLRAGGREDLHARCDALEDAVLDYFYSPTFERQLTLRQAHTRLDRRCKDEPTRNAARKLTFRVIDLRDRAMSEAELDEWNNVPYGAEEHAAQEEYEYNTAVRSGGRPIDVEAQLYLWIEEFHQVVRQRGWFVRARETAGRWLRAINPARLFRRRTAPDLPTTN